VKPAALRSVGSVRSQLGVLKEHLGNLPLSALEGPDEINRFKTDSEWAEDVEIASIHRVLERLRAAMNWGMAQTPPLFAESPLPPLRRSHEQEGRNGTRPSGLT
jgi:hypothetical protein